MRLRAVEPGTDVVGRGDDVLDEAVHVDRGGHEAGEVVALDLVVGVGGDVVDDVVGEAEDGRLPGAERRHRAVGAAARDELEVRVELAHGPGGLGGQPAVLVRRLVTQLPRAVHLVAQAPHPDAERFLGAVTSAQVGQVGALGVVAVLEQLDRLGHPARPEVDGEHDLQLGLRGPAGELAEAELVRLDRAPRRVQPGRPFGHRAHAVLPAVPRHEVAAGIAHDGDAEFTDEVEHVLPEPVRVRGRVPGLVEARVDVAAHVLHEGAEGPPVDGRDDEGRVDVERGRDHLALPTGDRRSGDEVAGCRQRQPFNPVPAMPSTMFRWKSRKTSTSGRPPRTAEAMTSAYRMP